MNRFLEDLWNHVPIRFRPYLFIAIFALAVLGLAPSIFSPTKNPGDIKVEIIVLTETGKPLEDVEVKVFAKGPPFTTYTNSSGFAQVSIPQREDVDVRLSKEGFEPLKETINFSVDSERNKTFRLKSATSIPQSELPLSKKQPQTVYRPNIPSGSPLVLLLDNSGSMGRCSVMRKTKNGKELCILDAERPYRIDVVKDAIRKRIDPSIYGVDLDSTRIGLVEFGNWKAYGSPGNPGPIPENANSVIKCQAVNILFNPELNNRSQLVNTLSNNTIKANDSGATPIGFAINTVINDVLRPQKLLPARILLISDGQPNCVSEYKSDLCDIVSGLNNRGVDLSLDIVGYKADKMDEETGIPGDQSFIDCAKKYAIVKYWGSRDTPGELLNIVDAAISYPSYERAVSYP